MAILSDRVLTPSELRALSARSDRPGAIRLAVHLALLVLAGWLVAVSSGWTLWPAMLALGLVQVALFAPSHETMHQTAFASRRANAIVGWLAFCPSLQNAQFYAAFHLMHHRHTNIPGQDPELLLPETSTLPAYVSRILGIQYWALRFQVIADSWRGDLLAYPYINQQQRPGVIRSVRAMSALMAGGAVASALAFGWQTPFLYWIVPQLIGQPFLRAYLITEHTGCTLDRNGLTNTRTTRTNFLVRLLMWEMPFHAEHHLYPSVPFHRLEEAHRQIGKRLGYLQDGYVRWNLDYVRNLIGRTA
jgi:fatty acid desaturase